MADEPVDSFADTLADAWVDTAETGWYPHVYTVPVYLSPISTALLNITPHRMLVKLC